MSVNLYIQTNPFEDGLDIEVTPGLSIARIVRTLDPSVLLLDSVSVLCFVDEVPVERMHWDFVVPSDGQNVVVVACPGSDFFKIAVGVGIAIASAFTGGLAAAAYGPMMGALAAAGTMMAGNILSNALIPPQASNLGDLSGGDSVSPHLSISGTENTARQYGVVPRVFGRVRHYPDLAAKPYLEVVGEDIFYRMLFCWGYGPVELSDLKIGDTVLSNFEGYEIEHSSLILDGVTYPDQDMTLFPSDVNEDAHSILLLAGEENVRTGADDADESIVDVVFTEGLKYTDEKGAVYPLEVKLRIECAPTGTDEWVSFDNADGEPNSGDMTIYKMFDPMRRLSFRTKHETRGQYDYRLQRITADTDCARTQNKVTWVTVRTVTAQPPIDRARMEPLAVTALRIKANDEFNGVINKFNGIVEAIKPVYDAETETWADQKERNAGWSMVDVLHSPVSGHGRSYDQIDLAEFGDLSERCQDRLWNFDAVIDYETTVLDLLKDIGSPCRCIPIRRANLWSVAQDKPQTVGRQMLGPRNSWGFTYTRERNPACHALRMRFRNEENDFAEDELIVYADGYSEDGAGDTAVATKFESDDCFGVVQPLHVAEIGANTFAKVKLRPEEWRLTTGHEGWKLELGDLVSVAAMEIGVFQCDGRIKTVNRNVGGQIVSVVVDEPCRMETGKEYSLQVRFSDGSQETRLVVTSATEFSTLLFSNEFGVAEPLPLAIQFDADAYFHFGVAGYFNEDLIVNDISYGQNGITNLVLEHAAPELHEADLNLPEFESNITNMPLSGTPIPAAPSIEAVSSDRGTATQGADGVPVYQIRARFRHSGGLIPLSGYQVRWRETAGDWQVLPNLPVSATEIVISPVAAGQEYELRVRAVSDKGMASVWATATGILIDTDSWDGPAAPVITHQIKGEHVVLSWQDCKTDLPIREYVLVGDPDDVGLGPGLSTSERITWSGARTWAIKAVDVAGNESAAVEHTVSVEDIPTPISLVTEGVTHGVKLTITHDVIDTLDGIEVWASMTNDRAYAGMVGMTRDGEMVHDGLSLVDHRFYWCRGRDVYGTTGEWYPSNDKLGVRGDTDAVNANIPEHSIGDSQLVRELTGITGDIALEPDILEQGVVVESVSDVEPLDIRMTGAENSWTVKLTRGNRIAGIGLLLDEEGSSEFAVLADQFFVVVDEDGELVQPFTVDGDGVVIRGDLIATGSIVAGAIAAGAVTGDKIHSQSDISIGDGGRFRTEDGSFEINTSGETTRVVMGEEGTVDSVGDIATDKDYVSFTARDIEFWRYLEGQQRLSKALRCEDAGWAENGKWTDLNGFWDAAPSIQLSPRNLTCYDHSSPSVNQALNMEVVDVRVKSGHTNVYEFKANARLVIASGTSDFTVGLSDSESSDTGTAQTAAYTTPAYCSAAIISYKVKAVKPEGTVNTYQNRQVVLKVYVDDVEEASRTITVGDTVDYLTGTISVSGLTADEDTHDIYLTATASDVTGTFLVGSVTYDYQNNSGSTTCNLTVYSDDEEALTLNLPSSPGTGWELTSATYALTCSNVYVSQYSAGIGLTTSSMDWIEVHDDETSASESRSSLYQGWKWKAYDSGGSAHGTLTGVTVTAYWRKPQTSTDSINTVVEFSSVSVTLSGANVLAEGTVNYTAVQ